MNQKQFAEKKLKVSESYFSLLLSGTRNAGKKLSKKIAKRLNTEPSIWMISDNNQSHARREAWGKYSSVNK